MSVRREGDRMHIEVSLDDWDSILVTLGAALGVVFRDPSKFYIWLAVINRLNEGNPHFIPYEIPEEFRAPAVQ